MKQHSSRFLSVVEESKKHIKEITAPTLKEKIDHNEPIVLIDVREDHEWSTGYIPTATHMSKGIIERDIEKNIPDVQTQIVVYCSGGFRSALVANSLQNMGYSQVYSLLSGLQGWIDTGYSIKK
jgi:rhodanese-related sulfurtransferase